MDIAIEDLTEEQAKNMLRKLVTKLDQLDEDDFFGTEGWAYFLGWTKGETKSEKRN